MKQSFIPAAVSDAEKRVCAAFKSTNKEKQLQTGGTLSAKGRRLVLKTGTGDYCLPHCTVIGLWFCDGFTIDNMLASLCGAAPLAG